MLDLFTLWRERSYSTDSEESARLSEASHHDSKEEVFKDPTGELNHGFNHNPGEDISNLESTKSDGEGHTARQLSPAEAKAREGYNRWKEHHNTTVAEGKTLPVLKGSLTRAKHHLDENVRVTHQAIEVITDPMLKTAAVAEFNAWEANKLKRLTNGTSTSSSYSSRPGKQCPAVEPQQTSQV